MTAPRGFVTDDQADALTDDTAAETPQEARGGPLGQSDPHDQPDGVSGPHTPVRAGLPAVVAPGLAPDLPIVPGDREVRTLASMAVTLAHAPGAVPRALAGKPNETFMVLLTGRDVGVSLTTALREMHVIDGKVTVSPKLKLALVHSSGAGKVWPDPVNDDQRATWYAERADLPGQRFSSTFTMEMAERIPAKENQRTIKLNEKSTWKAYPQRMLSWRALGYLLDDVFPEVGTGLYSPDELGALTDEDGRVIDVAEVAPPEGMKGGPRPPEAPPEPAPDEWKEVLGRRLSLLPEEARQSIAAAWRRRIGEGIPIPKLADALAKHMLWWEALFTSHEDRARKGEWGPWPPADPETGEVTVGQAERYEAEGDHQGGGTFVTDADHQPEVEVDGDGESTDAPSWSNDEELAELCTAEVKAMPLPKVRRDLVRGFHAEGVDDLSRDDFRLLLSLALFEQRGGTLDGAGLAVLARHLPAFREGGPADALPLE